LSYIDGGIDDFHLLEAVRRDFNEQNWTNSNDIFWPQWF
jgi:hypothetical protein